MQVLKNGRTGSSQDTPVAAQEVYRIDLHKS